MMLVGGRYFQGVHQLPEGYYLGYEGNNRPVLVRVHSVVVHPFIYGYVMVGEHQTWSSTMTTYQNLPSIISIDVIPKSKFQMLWQTYTGKPYFDLLGRPKTNRQLNE